MKPVSFTFSLELFVIVPTESRSEISLLLLQDISALSLQSQSLLHPIILDNTKLRFW